MKTDGVDHLKEEMNGLECLLNNRIELAGSHLGEYR